METRCHSRGDIGGVPCRLGAILQPLYARNQLFSYATRYHLCHLLPLLPDMVSVRILRLYFATESKNERFMETKKHCIGTMRNCKKKSLQVFSCGYPNIRSGKEAVSYRFTDLLSYCRTAPNLCRSACLHIQGFACMGRQCPVSSGKRTSIETVIHWDIQSLT